MKVRSIFFAGLIVLFGFTTGSMGEQVVVQQVVVQQAAVQQGTVQQQPEQQQMKRQELQQRRRAGQYYSD